MSVTLSDKMKIALQAFVLTTYPQGKASRLVKEVGFLFREIQRVEREILRLAAKGTGKLKQNHPDLSKSELFDLLINDKKYLIKFLDCNRREAVFCQCIILQVSSWLKSCYRPHVELLGRYSKKSELHWTEAVYKLGPRYGTKTWASAIEMASNYVRHKEEWNYNWMDFDIKSRKLKARRNIVSTMPAGKARKNAHFLIELGVSERDLFMASNDASKNILQRIGSLTAIGLIRNCNAWMQALNAFTEKTYPPLIRHL